MEALVISRPEYGKYMPLLSDMHRLRRRVFKDRLDWEVSVTGDMEVDRYDGLGPEYLLLLGADGELVGSVRFLSTSGPNMLADTFPQLLGGLPVPRSADLPESSRFCVDTARTRELGEAGLRQATFGLFAAMVEWALSKGYTRIVTVTDVIMERVLRRAEWPLDRIAPPNKFGAATAVAGYLEASWMAHGRLMQAGGLGGGALLRSHESVRAA